MVCKLMRVEFKAEHLSTSDSTCQHAAECHHITTVSFLKVQCSGINSSIVVALIVNKYDAWQETSATAV